MSEIIVLFIFLFLAVCGVSSLSAKLWLFFMRPHKKRNNVFVINIEGDENDENFFYAFEKYKWYGEEFADYIVFVKNSRLSKRANEYLSEYKNMYCCSETELGQLLKKLTEEEYERS